MIRHPPNSPLFPSPPLFDFSHLGPGEPPRRSVEKLLSVSGIPRGLRRSLHLRAAKIGHHLPDFFVAHAHADAAVGGRGHGGAGDAVVNVVKHFRVGVAVALLRTRKVRPAASATRTEPVAKSAIQPKLVLAELGDFRITRVRILFLRRNWLART